MLGLRISPLFGIHIKRRTLVAMGERTHPLLPIEEFGPQRKDLTLPIRKFMRRGIDFIAQQRDFRVAIHEFLGCYAQLAFSYTETRFQRHIRTLMMCRIMR